MNGFRGRYHLVNRRQFAELAGIRVRTLRKWEQERRERWTWFPKKVISVGQKVIFYDRAEVERWLEDKNKNLTKLVDEE